MARTNTVPVGAHAQRRNEPIVEQPHPDVVGIEQRPGEQTLLDHGISEPEQNDPRPPQPPPAGDLTDQQRATAIERNQPDDHRQGVDGDVAQQILTDQRRENQQAQRWKNALEHVCPHRL
jgi:hypothetical protein